jgi:hypothetical protein
VARRVRVRSCRKASFVNVIADMPVSISLLARRYRAIAPSLPALASPWRRATDPLSPTTTSDPGVDQTDGSATRNHWMRRSREWWAVMIWIEESPAWIADRDACSLEHLEVPAP